ncbi:MAG TPA: ABC transporter ATP-binding protein [Solirubrobacteraceae bacterium]
MSEPLLSVEDLRVSFRTDDGVVHAVDGISYQVQEGKTLGIVGESGSGKTVSSLTTLGLTRTRGSQIEGRIMFGGEDLVAMPDDQLRKIRGNGIAMIFQDPLSALHPFYTVGWQLVEAMRSHRSISRSAGRKRAVELLHLVGIPDPERRVNQHPHEFSGGMRQRAMIAMALANEPKLLIADEPTTALDVTVQAQILALLEDLQKRLGMAIIIITHDLGVVAEIADDIAVMYAGRIVERGTAHEIFKQPQHPYTWGLLKSIPRLDSPRDEELVPISGRPPSLINRPSGCHFHPRCPYVQESHRQIDPRLEPVAPGQAHSVACLLEPPVRERIWSGLREGRDLEALQRIAATSNGRGVPRESGTAAPAAAASTPPGAGASEGTS